MSMTVEGRAGRYAADCDCGWHADTLNAPFANALLEAFERHAATCPESLGELRMYGKYDCIAPRSDAEMPLIDASPWSSLRGDGFFTMHYDVSASS